MIARHISPLVLEQLALSVEATAPKIQKGSRALVIVGGVIPVDTLVKVFYVGVMNNRYTNNQPVLRAGVWLPNNSKEWINVAHLEPLPTDEEISRHAAAVQAHQVAVREAEEGSDAGPRPGEDYGNYEERRLVEREIAETQVVGGSQAQDAAQELVQPEGSLEHELTLEEIEGPGSPVRSRQAKPPAALPCVTACARRWRP